MFCITLYVILGYVHTWHDRLG